MAATNIKNAYRSASLRTHVKKSTSESKCESNTGSQDEKLVTRNSDTKTKQFYGQLFHSTPKENNLNASNQRSTTVGTQSNSKEIIANNGSSINLALTKSQYLKPNKTDNATQRDRNNPRFTMATTRQNQRKELYNSQQSIDKHSSMIEEINNGKISCIKAGDELVKEIINNDKRDYKLKFQESTLQLRLESVTTKLKRLELRPKIEHIDNIISTNDNNTELVNSLLLQPAQIVASLKEKEPDTEFTDLEQLRMYTHKDNAGITQHIYGPYRHFIQNSTINKLFNKKTLGVYMVDIEVYKHQAIELIINTINDPTGYANYVYSITPQQKLTATTLNFVKNKFIDNLKAIIKQLLDEEEKLRTTQKTTLLNTKQDYETMLKKLQQKIDENKLIQRSNEKDLSSKISELKQLDAQAQQAHKSVVSNEISELFKENATKEAFLRRTNNSGRISTQPIVKDKRLLSFSQTEKPQLLRTKSTVKIKEPEFSSDVEQTIKDWQQHRPTKN